MFSFGVRSVVVFLFGVNCEQICYLYILFLTPIIFFTIRFHCGFSVYLLLPWEIYIYIYILLLTNHFFFLAHLIFPWFSYFYFSFLLFVAIINSKLLVLLLTLIKQLFPFNYFVDATALTYIIFYISEFTFVNFKRNSGSNFNCVLYLFLIYNMAENPVSHKYDALKGIIKH